jgi:hypothetical protein
LSEFNNRIAAQREALRAVNNRAWSEELFGLSNGAIGRWISANRIPENDPLVELIRLAAQKLFFLSNKSQEQITEDYRLLSEDVFSHIKKIKKLINSGETINGD